MVVRLKQKKDLKDVKKHKHYKDRPQYRTVVEYEKEFKQQYDLILQSMNKSLVKKLSTLLKENK